ncbi:FUSC family protein [Streptomyces sp. NPDC005236]|uniref:FUSC family protein n=1 Tax=Streptomyces sp. NPDC005236 TaxID=3157028 RepID=UPI0033AECFCC
MAGGSSRAAEPVHTGKAGDWLSKVFERNPAGLDWPRGVLFLDVALVPLFVFWAIGYEQYLLSALVGLLFAALADPGGDHRHRAFDLAVLALFGAGVTASAFGIGADAWVPLALASFVVMLASGLAAVFGARGFADAALLDTWFVVAIALESGLSDSDRVSSQTWAQVLAWTAGAALWILVTFLRRLVHGRTGRSQPFQELHGNTRRRKPAPPLIRFAVIRALVVAGTVALAYGLDLPHGSWIPVVAVIAMKPSLEQATVVGAQRLTGALIGAAVATLLLSVPPGEHGIRLFAVERGLEVVALVLFAHGAGIRFWSRTYRTAAIAAGALVLVDLPGPPDQAAEGYRVLWTLCGVGIGLLALLLADTHQARLQGTTATGLTPAARHPDDDEDPRPEPVEGLRTGGANRI